MTKDLKKKEDLLNVVARNVAEIKTTVAEMSTGMARRFDDIEGKMATKEDLKNLEIKLEFKIEDSERRLSNKIDHVDEKIDNLEQFTIRPMEDRISILEKIKQTKNKHG